jgi:DNA-binding NarL/FixJ family response regulator
MKTLIVDDYDLSNDGIYSLLIKTDPNMHIDKAYNGNDAKEKVISTDYDLVLLDIKLPDMSGMQVLKFIKDKKPFIKVVMISSYLLKQYVSTALDLKASGFLSKDISSSEFKLAIQIVMSNKIYLSSTITNIMLSQTDKSDYDKKFDGLAESQKLVYPYVIDGKKDKEIGLLLNKSPKSVSTDVYRILKQMECKTIAHLVKQYMQYNNTQEY